MSNEIGLSDFDFEDCEPITEGSYEASQRRRTIRTVRYRTYHVRADSFYAPGRGSQLTATPKLRSLQQAFERQILEPYRFAKAAMAQPRTAKDTASKHKDRTCLFSDVTSAMADSSSDIEESDSDSDLEDVLNRQRNHPALMHKELWFNDPGEMNDGPLCRCCWKARQRGIAHEIYSGESVIKSCDSMSNNYDQLYYYKLCVSPEINLSKEYSTTIIMHEGQEYKFDGFGILCHQEVPDAIPGRLIDRWNIEYTLTLEKEPPPKYYTIEDCRLFWQYFFVDLMELYDVNLFPSSCPDGCPVFHAVPRFVLANDHEGCLDMLPMSSVLEYLFHSYRPVFPPAMLNEAVGFLSSQWNKLAAGLKGQLVSNPVKRPSAIRLDQIDRADESSSVVRRWPVIIHFGVRPAVMTYCGNPEYQRAYKKFRKYRHAVMMKSKLLPEDKSKLAEWEEHLQNLKEKANAIRDVTVEVSCNGFYQTGIYSDMVQHGLMLIVMFRHIRFHLSLRTLEERMQYTFKDRALLELALTHPSYRANYATNADHVRNTLTNCGLRRPEYGRRHPRNKLQRKRGIQRLVEVMSHMAFKTVKESDIINNERLEFLGDSVIEFLTTIHLYFLFPDLEEGGLATFRSSLVQNSHLALLARKLGLDQFMLYAHGPDLCHEADLKHAMANAFEALLGALFLDGGISLADRVYGNILFPESEDSVLHWVWFHPPKHPLQAQEPSGDRHLIDGVEVLRQLTEFEQQIGIEFAHIRLLARAFTRKSVGYNFLTLGHNQRMEFLGDTVLQLITSEYLFKYFPGHQEGHLSLLRSCLVSNKTQAIICDDIGMSKYIIPANGNTCELRMKDKADLVEAFLGALFVDKGLEYCKLFCQLCFFPRLKHFIVKQQWSDPKTRLQQSCLSWRDPDGGEPEIPQYKVVCVEGAANTREYKVAVYFRSTRLAVGYGQSKKDAEIKAAEAALQNRADLLPNIMHPKKRY